MHTLRSTIVLFLLVLPAGATAQAPRPDADTERRIDALLNQMTLAEKLGQMSQTSFGGPLPAAMADQLRSGRWGSLFNIASREVKMEAQRLARSSRLGIPLVFGADVIHGYQTVVPIPLGQAASWDPPLVQQAARMAALEAAAEAIDWTFAPMLDIARDPRWGRIAESPGEDPFLVGVMGAAMVRGFQGEGLGTPGSVAACGKHYVGYGAAEGGRDYNTTWIPEILLREVYLPPFRAARDAGAASFMTAFNDLNGVPASANPFTIRSILRDEWKFDGLVVSDYTAIQELIAHGFAADAREAALRGIRAGVDMEMVSTHYFDHALALIEAGKLDPKLIDESVRNILRLKLRLGLFDRKEEPPAGPAAMLSPEALAVSRKLAAESLVLLKNGGVLPLSREIGKLAVTGPLADAPGDQMGTWAMNGNRDAVRTPLAALRERLGDGRVAWAPGLKNSRDLGPEGFAAAVAAARSADAVLLFLGEEANLSGEARSRAYLNLPGAQAALVDAVAAAGKPMVAVFLAGRPLTFHEVAGKVDAIVYAWHPGTMGGPAIADVLFGEVAPAGKLPVTFPRTVGQIPIYYAHRNTGRPPSAEDLGIPPGSPLDPKGYVSKYIDVDHTPEYPFGFGLSYTTFHYANVRLSAERVPLGGTLTVTADVTNTGKVGAHEVVQLYVRDVAGRVTRPVRELKGFRRVWLEPGATQAVAFTLKTDDLALVDETMRWTTEPGEFRVWIAPDSDSGIQGSFEVVE